jgi:chromosomal replication initiation ATPase DnaA
MFGMKFANDYFCGKTLKTDFGMIGEKERLEIDRVNEMLCQHFGVAVEDMRSKNKNRTCTAVKSYALYYLHKEKKMSATLLSRAYKLHRRVVFNHLSKIQGYIDIYSTTKKEYAELCELLNEK